MQQQGDAAMRIVFILVLLVGVGLAAFAVSVAKDRFDQYQTALAQSREAIVPTTDVFIVTRQVRYGDPLRPADVRAIRWPAAHVPIGAFTSAEELFPEGEEARVVLRTMEASEPILASKVTAPGADAGVASRLESGMRALALRVDVTSGVSGFLRPGDRVDVYWTGTGRNGDRLTRLIRSNVQIIAVDQIADEDRNNPTIARTITVTADPNDIAALTQAQASGSLTLALVGVRDETVSDMVEFTTNELLGAEEIVQSAAPEICTVRARRGGELVVTQVPCTN
jgi:pilus assembly protein CpaB